MNVKIKTTNIVATMVLCAATTIATADNGIVEAPYVGAEVIQTNLNYKHEFGSGVYHNSPQDYNAFVGLKFNGCTSLGLEAGYEYQVSKSKSVTLADGDYPPGLPAITSPNSERMISKIKGEHPYLGVFWEVDPQMIAGNQVKLQFMLGASYSHINASDTVTSVNGTPSNEVNNYSQYKFIPMAKVMVGHNLTNNLGVRLSLSYHNFTRFKINSENGNGQIRLKDTLGLGLGLTYAII